jgi:hypothetical protein
MLLVNRDKCPIAKLTNPVLGQFFQNIRSEDNWNFSHSIRTRLTPHAGLTCQVARWPKRWNNYKNRNLGSIYAKYIIFLPTPCLPTLRTHFWAHLWNSWLGNTRRYSTPWRWPQPLDTHLGSLHDRCVGSRISTRGRWMVGLKTKTTTLEKLN